MPFVRVDAYEGRSKKQVKNLLDAISLAFACTHCACRAVAWIHPRLVCGVIRTDL
jgi:hypothetical protein